MPGWGRASAQDSDDKVRENLELLEWVIGTWTDQFESTYSVQLDGGVSQDRCTVFTTRKSGRTLKTKGLIRIVKGQVWWSTSYFLDRDASTFNEIRWQVYGRRNTRMFKWHRRQKELSQEEIGQKVLALRAPEKPSKDSKDRWRHYQSWTHWQNWDHWRPTSASEDQAKDDPATEAQSARVEPSADQAPVAPGPDDEASAMDDAEHAAYDVENESDDDDIVAEPHPWRLDQQRLPVEDLRWAQDTIGIRFRDGTYLVEALKEMLEGRLQPSDLPTFRVVLYEDQLFAVTGNRRLWVLKEYARLSRTEVKVFVELHPPAAMEAKWCKRRFTSQSCGQQVRFVHRSFADITYASMQDALDVAGRNKCVWQWYKWKPVEKVEEQTAEEQVEQPEQQGADATGSPPSEATGSPPSGSRGQVEDEMAERALFKLLHPDGKSPPPSEFAATDASRQAAQEQLCFVAGQRHLFWAAEQLRSQAQRLNDAGARHQVVAASELMKLSAAMHQVAETFPVDENSGNACVKAAEEIEFCVEQLQWIDCPLELGVQLHQMSQRLRCSSCTWVQVPDEYGQVGNFSDADQELSSFFSPSSADWYIFLPPSSFPAPQWLWRWQMSGQLAGMRSLHALQQAMHSNAADTTPHTWGYQ
ncbi:Uncharacterized protein SCF082_LOCUS7117 [Durusdinium trenchii]|uniref:Uncharacterized protein n=1 Tax=Durusdinium trenchii TaxID=1381693 RepID=A0ABP0IH44_9DINO